MIKETIRTIGRFAFGVGVGLGIGLAAWGSGVIYAARTCFNYTPEELEAVKENTDDLDHTIREIK